MIVCLLMLMVRDDCLLTVMAKDDCLVVAVKPSTNKQSSLTITINKQTIISHH
jgi:hypothetical protein